MAIHAVDKLMQQTRTLAADYYRTTGKTLAVTPDLAKYDAMHVLELKPSDLNGVDACGQGRREGLNFQIKGRVIFDESKKTYRIGQLAWDIDWDALLLVLYHQDYQPFAIFQIERSVIDESMQEGASTSKRTKRGVISVAKLRALGECVWTPEEGEIVA